MTPEQISALSSIAVIIKTVGSLPISMVLLLIFVGPWVGMVVASAGQGKRLAAENQRFNKAIATQNERVNQGLLDFKELVQAMAAAQEKRFESVVRMYENNAELVKGYEGLAGELTSIIHLNTQVQTHLADAVKNNQFCPTVRKETGA